MNEKRKAKWVAQTHSLENMADMMNREMRGYMYGMLESYRHYKPLIMGAIHA